MKNRITKLEIFNNFKIQKNQLVNVLGKGGGGPDITPPPGNGDVRPIATPIVVIPPTIRITEIVVIIPRK